MSLPLSRAAFSASRLGLGTASFLPGYGLTQAQGESATGEVLTSALALGIRYFDTAPAYGEAETFVGQALGRSAPADGVRVVTKVLLQPGEEPSAIEESLKRSLDRLQMSQVDSLLWHNATAAGVADVKFRKAFERCRDQGLCRRIGGTTYGAESALAAVESGWCDVVQFEFSVLNPSVLHAITGRKPPGQEWISRSILCKGLLTETGCGEFPDLKIQEGMALVRAVSQSRNCSLEALAYAFGLSCPEIDVILVGARNTYELKSALDVTKLSPFTEEEWARLAQADCSECEESHPERWSGLAGKRRP